MIGRGDRVKIEKGDWKGYAGKVRAVERSIAYVDIDNPPALFEGQVTAAIRKTSLSLIETQR